MLLLTASSQQVTSIEEMGVGTGILIVSKENIRSFAVRFLFLFLVVIEDFMEEDYNETLSHVY